MKSGCYRFSNLVTIVDGGIGHKERRKNMYHIRPITGLMNNRLVHIGKAKIMFLAQGLKNRETEYPRAEIAVCYLRFFWCSGLIAA